jgi:hypothetical protein
MVVKNNYYWLEDSKEVSFIANGDIGEVMRIYKYTDLYGFHFAEVQLRLIDYPGQAPFDTVILLDTLTSESPSLTFEESNRLYQEVAQDYSGFKSKYKIMLGFAFKGICLEVVFGPYKVPYHAERASNLKKKSSCLPRLILVFAISNRSSAVAPFFVNSVTGISL